MKRPRISVKNLLFFSPLLLWAGILSFGLAGFLFSSSSEKKDHDDSMVNIEVLIKQVLALNQNREHQKAIDLLLKTLESQKEDSLLRALLVQTFDPFLEDEIRNGQIDIQKNRKNKEAYMRMAGALELLGDNFRAMETLINGVSQDTGASDLWMKIAKLELKASRDLEALDVFREIIKLDTKNSKAFNGAAQILAKSEHGDTNGLKEAEKLADRAVKLEPKNPEYLDTLAEVQFKRGKQKTAKSLMEEVIKLAPNRAVFKDHLKKIQSDISVTEE